MFAGMDMVALQTLLASQSARADMCQSSRAKQGGEGAGRKRDSNTQFRVNLKWGPLPCPKTKGSTLNLQPMQKSHDSELSKSNCMHIVIFVYIYIYIDKTDTHMHIQNVLRQTGTLSFVTRAKVNRRARMAKQTLPFYTLS